MEEDLECRICSKYCISYPCNSCGYNGYENEQPILKKNMNNEIKKAGENYARETAGVDEVKAFIAGAKYVLDNITHFANGYHVPVKMSDEQLKNATKVTSDDEEFENFKEIKEPFFVTPSKDNFNARDVWIAACALKNSRIKQLEIEKDKYHDQWFSEAKRNEKLEKELKEKRNEL